MPRIIYSIRYSILTKDSPNWIISRDRPFEEYKRDLFDEERLRAKEILFQNVCLPSLLSQEGQEDTTILVHTSSELPSKNLRFLEEIEKSNPAVSIDLVDPEARVGYSGQIERIMQDGDDPIYAHVRIDDDDALSVDYARNLRRYLKDEFCGFAVSFGKGYFGRYDEKTCRYTQFSDAYYPKISAGLAYVGKFSATPGSRKVGPRSVFALGAHTKVDASGPVILDSSFSSFLYSVYGRQDTSGNKSYRFGDRVETETIRKKFALSPRIFA